MPIPMNMEPREEKRELNWWHFSNNTKPDYKDTLEGTLIEIDIVQKRSWNDTVKKSVPEFWPDGNPKRGYRWIILDAVTGIPTAFEFSDNKNDSFKRGLAQSIPGLTDMESLGGHYLRIHTPDGVYNLQHPRPFTVQDLGLSNVAYEGTKDYLSEVKPASRSPFPDMQWNQHPSAPSGYQPTPQYQQPTPQQQPIQQNVPQQGVMPGGYPAQNTTQYQSAQVQQQVPQQQVPMQVQQAPAQNPVAGVVRQTVPGQVQQPVYQQPVQQPVQPMPQQQVIQQPVQVPQQPATNAFYDADIPF